MKTKAYRLVYETEFVRQLKFIEKKFHSMIKAAIEDHLVDEPDKNSRNRKPLTRPIGWGARWVLRCGNSNEFRVFYSVYPQEGEVHILAVGMKVRERFYIGGKEI
jgi:mRNA-degrading endonuclease RelE of RelBE toxin-antitoxin system